MTALALLDSAFVERKYPRYIFRCRGAMAAGATTIHVRTLDISEQGFGVIANEPVKIGKTCSLVLNSVVGQGIIELTFSCNIVYCILTGVEGFRIGLQIPDIDTQRQRLQKIIVNCSPSFFN